MWGSQLLSRTRIKQPCSTASSAARCRRLMHLNLVQNKNISTAKKGQHFKVITESFRPSVSGPYISYVQRSSTRIDNMSPLHTLNIRAFSTSSKEDNPKANADADPEMKLDQSQTAAEVEDEITHDSPPPPWRRDATDPLPRVLFGDDLSGLDRNWRAKFAQKGAAAFELQVDQKWQIFLPNAAEILPGIGIASWENDLAWNFAQAFSVASSGLLARYYNVPLSKIDIGTSDVDNYQYVSLDTRSDTCATDEEEDAVESTDEESSSEEETQVEEDDEFVSGMVEESLLKLYTPPQAGRTLDTDIDTDTDANSSMTSSASTPEVYFYLKPIRARMESFSLVPTLTRDDVKKDPSLKNSYKAIELDYKESKDWRKIEPLFISLKEKVEALAIEEGKPFSNARTIIVDVSIDCIECFQTPENEKGEGEEIETTHIARFEMVTKAGQLEGFEASQLPRELGSWILTDIDDQLDGNIWH